MLNPKNFRENFNERIKVFAKGWICLSTVIFMKENDSHFENNTLLTSIWHHVKTCFHISLDKLQTAILSGVWRFRPRFHTTFIICLIKGD
ncbi:hypothetical protein CDAR_165201 [Caerostris darwini]|uniref:Uncharacterized protein n=1 Tax=Caerostris darwini TaxID=1538125 RepID=A0AAV4NYR8_9ARAC|nr:hypothetical protein CDAR_165201 [Caerostris darwini]